MKSHVIYKLRVKGSLSPDIVAESCMGFLNRSGGNLVIDGGSMLWRLSSLNPCLFNGMNQAWEEALESSQDPGPNC